jgi:formylmethanofuran:tetrahydromethanopterin formyltransferase
MPRFTQDNAWLMGQEIGAALDDALAAIDALKEKP